MSNHEQGMTRQGALRLEFFIIGLGIFALLLIFQPFSLQLFAIGSVLVVIAGLINNLLPMAQPGVKVRSVVIVGMVVAMTGAGLVFCWLRIRSRSLVAPFVLHAGVNGTAFALAWAVVHH